MSNRTSPTDLRSPITDRPTASGIEVRVGNRARRIVVLSGVVALHGCLALLLVHAVRPELARRARAPSSAPIWTAISVPKPERASPTPNTSGVTRNPLQAPEAFAPTVVAPTLPTIPTSPEPATATLDWHAEARHAATALLRDQAIRSRQQASIGSIPYSNFDLSTRHWASGSGFAWGRQPLTSWFDVDPDTFTVQVALGRRCGLAFFLVLPALGCVIGPINPEPGRGDLFDHMDRRSTLQLPVPLLTDQRLLAEQAFPFVSPQEFRAPAP